jgi:uroporphyrinogen decarboxylase
MTPSERIRAVIAGVKPDRPPVSFWCHFPLDRAEGDRAIAAHLEHVRRYDLDLLKVMCDGTPPWRLDVRRADDLRRLATLHGNEGSFARQLELIRALASRLQGRVPVVTTVFNAWAVLRRIVVPRDENTQHGPPVLDGPPAEPDLRLAELIAEDRTAVGEGLDIVAHSLAGFARACIEAGADGIFLSVRDDWVDTPGNGTGTYDEMVRTGDGQILQAAAGGWFNILHVCGVPRDFEAFATYPVAGINWADRAAGPAIREVIGRVRPVVCAGVDNLHTLPRGSPDDVQREVRDALHQAGDRPIIIAPGCTFDSGAVPEANLRALCAAVRA